jgi:hypothetical protein
MSMIFNRTDGSFVSLLADVLPNMVVVDDRLITSSSGGRINGISRQYEEEKKNETRRN